MKKIFSPSVMCADLGHLRNEIRLLEEAGVDIFHMDIMDGEFVPNFALSWQDFSVVRQLTALPMDVHLMVKNLDVHLPYAFRYGADIIYIHYEATSNPLPYLQKIREHGKKAGLAVNPETTLEEITPLLNYLDKLLVMRVNPGFAGANNVETVEQKIEDLIAMDPDCEIALDGSVGCEIIEKWSKIKDMEYILGTRCGLFGKNREGHSYMEVVENLRNI